MELIIFVIICISYFIFYVSKSTASATSTVQLLSKVFKAQGFANQKTVYYSSNLNIIRADANGENYLFAYRNDSYIPTTTDISKLHDLAQKLHIHSTVLVSYTPIPNTHPSYRKVREYNIDVWDYSKLLALTKTFDATKPTETTHHILRTSNTSDDTCKIDTSSYDPIQENPISETIFSGLFNKPDRL